MLDRSAVMSVHVEPLLRVTETAPEPVMRLRYKLVACVAEAAVTVVSIVPLLDVAVTRLPLEAAPSAPVVLAHVAFEPVQLPSVQLRGAVTRLLAADSASMPL